MKEKQNPFIFNHKTLLINSLKRMQLMYFNDKFKWLLDELMDCWLGDLKKTPT